MYRHRDGRRKAQEYARLDDVTLIQRLSNGKFLKLGGGAGMTDELLTRLYNNPPLNARVTFTYEELSADGIPLRPQYVAIRNYE